MFKQFANAVHAKAVEMFNGPVFQVSKSGLTDLYLASFPEGTDLLHITNTTHHCNCCFQFINNVGNMVTVNEDGTLDSIWNVADAPHPYDSVAKALHEAVVTRDITGIYRREMRTYGAEQQGGFNHFWVRLPKHLVTTDGEEGSLYEGRVSVLRKSLRTITADSLKTVKELIDTKVLYRGETYKAVLEDYMELRSEHRAMNGWYWLNAARVGATLGSSALGKMLQKLSEGESLEGALAMFEAMVAPANYRRPVAVASQAQIDAAIKAIGDPAALVRCHVAFHELSVSNMKWVRQASKELPGFNITSLMTPAKSVDISEEEFYKRLPEFLEIDVLLENRLTPRLFVFTGGRTNDGIFKWDNTYAWSYMGNTTDAVRERVKTRGGNINAPLRFSLAWSNTDDLDLGVTGPDNLMVSYMRYETAYAKLDIDANRNFPFTTTPVENIAYTAARNGRYKVSVQNYNKRGTSGGGYQLQVEYLGRTFNFSAPSNPRQEGFNTVLEAEVRDDDIKFTSKLAKDVIPQTVWGVSTGQFVKVMAVMDSPNCWGETQIGMKHKMLILDGVKADEPVRGIYNEYLRADLDAHRRALELIGEKSQVAVADVQCGGLGFATSDCIQVRVTNQNGKIENFNLKVN